MLLAFLNVSNERTADADAAPLPPDPFAQVPSPLERL